MILPGLYIGAATYAGDRVCRHYCPAHSVMHRVAVAFLVGAVGSAAVTYLGALLFHWTSQPLLWGNLVWAAGVAAIVRWIPRLVSRQDLPVVPPRPPGRARGDWLTLAACGALGAWLLYSNLRFDGSAFWFGFKSWTDFGANLSLAQSFVLGHNVPTEHPFFPGVTVRYHFLFWFLSANVSWLGLDLARSVNLLSALSVVSVAALLMTLCEQLFSVRAVGRLAAVLFFVPSSSLAFVPFLAARHGVADAVTTILSLQSFLPSGFPYRGEDWGALSVGVFVNQRHLISATGLLLVALVCLGDVLRHAAATGAAALAPAVRRPALFAGVILGALPYWNSAVYVAALMVLGGLWLTSAPRRVLVLAGIAALAVGLPQVLLLRSGDAMAPPPPLFHPGYTIADPSAGAVLAYLGWTFGVKWLLLASAWWHAAARERRWLAGVSVLVPAVFLLQLSTDAFNNHKLLNLWNVLTLNVVAFALWRMWQGAVWRRVLAVGLAAGLTAGAVIDLMPVRNDPQLEARFGGERLTTWLLEHTEPDDVFLSQTLLTHPILFTGRRLFLGYTLFAWSAGYRIDERVAVYTRLFTERDERQLRRLLHDSRVRYVAFDDGVRGNAQFKAAGHNEDVYRRSCPVVFEDTERRHDNLIIYEVPLY